MNFSRQTPAATAKTLAAALLMMAWPALAQAPAAQQAEAAPATSASADAPTAAYAETDVLKAVEDVFGKGAEGLAEIVRKTFKDQGQPTAYIIGREVSGAFVVGLRYGSGMLNHKIEGERKVHWTGPSVGVDFGGDGSKVFALVYNLNDGEDIFQRFGAVEGKAYLIGGFTANYMQRGRVVVVPIKLGVGGRLGVNVGYLKYSKKGRVLPF